jgi:hypothetical protein
MDKISQDILDAIEVGIQAGKDCKPVPMRVIETAGEGRVWDVPDGACGFAWVEFKGNSKIGRRVKQMFDADTTPRNGMVSGHKGYPSGYHLWVFAFGQSYDRKSAMAGAIAGYLRSKGYDDVWSAGRLD